MEQLPVFVKLESPNELKALLDELFKTISETESTLERIHDLSNKEAEKILEWKNAFDGISSKLETIGKILPEPERI